MIFRSLFSFEGWVAWVSCLALYLQSTTSIGKKSLTHSWFFESLTILKPTQESVAAIAGVAVSSSARRKRQTTKVPKTIEERLNVLDLATSIIHPGMLTANALKKKDELLLWQSLDSTIVFVVSCVVALILRWLFSWIQVCVTACCSDLTCWMAWLEGRQVGLPLLGLLVTVAVWHVYSLGCLISQLPKESMFRYTPSTYVTSYLFGLATLWLLNTPPLLEFLRIPADDALEEASARLLLWIKLVGIRVKDDEASLESWTSIARFLTAGGFGLLAFAISDPLGETVRLLVYRFYSGPTSHTPHTNRAAARSYQNQVRAAYALLILLSQMIVLTYLTPHRPNRLGARTFLAWIVAGLLFFLVKPLLQSHLEQCIPSVVVVFADPKPSAETILYQFQGRIQRLVRTGSKLTLFPSLLVLMLTMGHLCRTPHSMYPGTHRLGVESATITQWKQQRALHTVESATSTGNWVNFISSTRANACGQTLSLPEEKGDVSGVIETAKDLVLGTPPIPGTLAQVLSGLQDKTREEKGTDSAGDEETNKPSAREIVLALVRHPFLTSTIVAPILDLLGLMLASLWTVSCVWGFFSSRKEMREMASYNLTVANKAE